MANDRPTYIIRFRLMRNQNHIYKDFDKALLEQKKRYLLRCKRMLKHKKNDNYLCRYITITFNDSTLENTSKQTRLRYVKKWLNSQTKEYILNRDYGDNNKREHYHALIIPKADLIIYDSFNKIGYIKARFIKGMWRFKYNHKETTAERLTNHAFKDSTRESKIIYSRKQPKHNRISHKDSAKIKERIKKLKTNKPI